MYIVKKLIVCLLCLALLSVVVPVSASALENDTDISFSVDVPQIYINTADGNGTSLEKADGYVDATFSLDGKDEESVLFKVRGNSTAMTQKKPFTFKFEKKKDLFSMGKGKKWVLLANAFDPTLMRSYIAFDFAKELGLPYTSEQKIVELWLDGTFRGTYTLMEPVQAGKDRVDIDVENNRDFMLEYESLRTDEDTTYITVDKLRFGISEPENPSDEQVTYITETLQQLTDIMKSGNRDEIEKVIDISSFAKFYLLNEFIKTNDFNFSSVFFYYKDGKLYAGPPWDYDLSMGNVNKDFSQNSASAFKTDGYQIKDKLFYKKLCSYDWFMLEVRREYAKHSDYISNIYREGGLIDSLLENYSDVFNRNYNEAGWKIRYLINVMMKPLPTYDENLDFLRTWCESRDEWLYDDLDISSMYYLFGDSNGDEFIDITDVSTIQRLLANMIEDEDGSIKLRGSITGEPLSIVDATYIQKYLADIPVPYNIGDTKIR